MLSESDEKKVSAAILSGQESAGSLMAMIEPTLSAHVDANLDSFSICLSLLASSSHQSNKKRKSFGEEELIRDSSTLIIDDDDFLWRKYAQRFIKNSPNQRSYYRCSERNCNARKHVQMIQDPPSIFRTTYVGLHTCQAQVFLYPAHENGSSEIIQSKQASSDSINGEKSISVAVMNEGYSGDYKLSPSESDFYFDRFFQF